VGQQEGFNQERERIVKHHVRPQRGPSEWLSGWSACSALIIGIVAASALACEDGNGALDAANLDWTSDPPPTVNGLAPRDGEDCAEEGASVPCGKVTERFDDYVTCSEGYRACLGGKWDACIGSRTTQKPTATGAVGAQLLSLGAPAQCAAGFDVCDPYCNNVIDTPGNFVSGGQVTYDTAKLNNTTTGITPIATGVGNCTALSLTVSSTTPLVGGDWIVTQFSPLTTNPANPLKFQLTATPAGCATGAFDTTWAVDKVDRASISGTTSANGTLTLAWPVAGTLRVTAFAKGLVASLDVPVAVNVLDTATAAVSPNTAASSGDVSAFGTSTSPLAGTLASTATWLYPYADTYFPLGLLAPVLQYKYSSTCGNGRSVKYSLRYPAGASATSADFNYSIIVKEGNNASVSLAGAAAQTGTAGLDPQVIIPQTAWTYFEQTARDDDAELIVQRLRSVNSAGTSCSGSPTTLEQEKRLGIHFVDGQLKGTVFYNSYTSVLGGNIGAVLKIDPGQSAAVAVQPTSNGTSSGTRKCTVCHSLSLDGSKLISNTDLTSMITGGAQMNNTRRYNMAVASPNFRNPTVLNTYLITTSSEWPADSDARGNRYTYGAPWINGTHYMTHGGSTTYGGEHNWRAPDDYSKFYRLNTSTVLNPTDTAISVTGWGSGSNYVSAVYPRFSPDGNKLAFAFWGASATKLPCHSTAIAPCTTSGTRQLSPDSGGKRLVVVDFNVPADPQTNTTNWSVTNARDVTHNVASPHKVAWPSFTPDGNAVAYQRQYRGPLIWSASSLNTVTGALGEIWLSDVPTTGATTATPTRLLALNGLSPSCSATSTSCSASPASYLPTAHRTVSPPATNYHAANASMTVWVPDTCSSSATASGVNDYQLNYLPSFNPTEAGGYRWVIFSSRRMYGNIAYGHPWDAEPGTTCELSPNVPSAKKLWISAIDKTWTAGSDPSHPAFYLPGQEINAGNSNAYWVNSACTASGGTCSTNDDCCGGTGDTPTAKCKVTSIAPVTKQCASLTGACSGVGQECSTSSQCCTGLVCPTGGGTCLNIPVPIFETQTMLREYTANCAYGTEVRWRFFEWQADLPTGTSISFAVQTKATSGATYQPVAPLTVATASGVSNPTTWYHGSQTTDQALVAAGLFSRNYLLVKITFNPNVAGSAVPTLKGWRQIYDCVPAQ
jgi:hypothetical protein